VGCLVGSIVISGLQDLSCVLDCSVCY
jgi:hypothetical protein